MKGPRFYERYEENDLKILWCELTHEFRTELPTFENMLTVKRTRKSMCASSPLKSASLLRNP
jgi:hypothetical protein